MRETVRGVDGLGLLGVHEGAASRIVVLRVGDTKGSRSHVGGYPACMGPYHQGGGIIDGTRGIKQRGACAQHECVYRRITRKTICFPMDGCGPARCENESGVRMGIRITRCDVFT